MNKSRIFDKKIIYWVAAFGLLGLMQIVQAQSPVAPDALLRNVTQSVLSDLEKNQSRLKGNTRLAYDVVKHRLEPYIEQGVVARSVVGREGWIALSQQQKAQFTKAITKMVLKTYASALTNYKGENVVVLPLRGEVDKKKRIQVYSVVQRKSEVDLPVVYKLILRQDGWRIYDVSVEGVSLLNSFRSQFRELLNKHDLDTVLKKINSKNAQW